VLAVHWSAENFPGTAQTDAIIRKVLLSRSHVPVDYYAEYLESDRFPNASVALRDYIRRKYRGRHIDVVIANADPALQFVLQNRKTLFPDAPIVFLGTAMAAASARRAGADVTGIVGDVAYGKTLELALALHPSTQRVYVVAQAPTFELQDNARDELSAFAQRVSLVYLGQGSITQLLASIKAVPPRSLILYLRYSREDPGNLVFPDEIARLVAEVSPVPVYGITDLYIGSGIVGGMVRQRTAMGTRTGEIVLQLLAGKRPRDIPFEPVALAPTFDWRQLQRWGVSPSRLPPESVIQFQEPTTWERYRWQIITAVSLMICQALLIGALLTQRARRRRAEEVNRTSETALRTSYERIRHLAGRLINAQEAARTRVAADLHDDVSQELAGLSIAVSSLKRWQRNIQDTVTQEALSALQRRALGLVERVRRLSHDLHPGTLRHVGLAGALEAHCVEVEERYDIQVTFNVEGDLRYIGDDAALCLFRISQEAMRNAATHGHARRLTVSASRSTKSVELTITDDGTGFDLGAARQGSDGLGLVSMEERARAAGGQVHIVTEPRQGTTVRVTVPAGVKHDAERTGIEAEAGSSVLALVSGETSGGRHESSQSLDRRRSQAVCRGDRGASQRAVRDSRHRRRRQPAERSSSPSPAGRGSA
jgi:signal transduction histidine kinase